jgi:hypothetical protein
VCKPHGLKRRAVCLTSEATRTAPPTCMRATRWCTRKSCDRKGKRTDRRRDQWTTLIRQRARPATVGAARFVRRAPSAQPPTSSSTSHVPRWGEAVRRIRGARRRPIRLVNCGRNSLNGKGPALAEALDQTPQQRPELEARRSSPCDPSATARARAEARRRSPPRRRRRPTRGQRAEPVGARNAAQTDDLPVRPRTRPSMIQRWH